MFKLESITFWHKEDSQTYRFSSNSFIYGPNTVGKTALTKAIDFVLGGSEGLTYQGLDNIDSIEAYISNGKTNLWIKRTRNEEYFYKRTLNSHFSSVGPDVYKDNICLIISETPNSHLLDVYKKVFGERPSFRSFNFLNYIEEKGLGDLSVVFTKARELKHQIRIRNVMNFFFNYENIEQLYEKEVRLEQVDRELSELSRDYHEYTRSIFQAKKLFSELQLSYSDDIAENIKIFDNFKTSFVRKAKANSKDLVYLSKSSFALSEEIKFYSFMKNQSRNMIDRKERTSRLLSLISSIISDHPEYAEYSQEITSMIEEIESENVILSLTDYTKAIKHIENEKSRLDDQIAYLRNQASDLTYEDAMKKVGLLEHIFSIISRGFDIEQFNTLSEESNQLKAEIKALRSSFNLSNIKKFNKTLSSYYLESDISIKHLLEDKKEDDFSLEFDPFKLCLYAIRKEKGNYTHYMPGSMTRQTHLQMLTYLCMFNYLRDNFPDFIYLPLLIIDSANQPMGNEVFEKVYPTIIALAKDIGIQTIFMSKDCISDIDTDDFIDISKGLNKFHKKAEK